MPRALIVGAGPAGPAASIFSRKAGLECVVLEKSSQVAPLVRGFRRKGLEFETGFHYAGGLGPGGILRQYLDHLAIGPHLEVRPLPAPGGESLRWADSGQDLAIPGRFESFRELFRPSPELDDFFRAARAEFDSSPFLNLTLRPETVAGHDRGGPTLAQALAPLGLSDAGRSALSFRCLLYGVKPSETSFTDHSLVNVPYLNGAHSIKGGGAALARAFEKAALEAGVSIMTGREVTALKTDSANRITGLASLTNDGRAEGWLGDYCLYSGNPAALPGLLPAGSLRPVLVRRLSQLKQSPPPLMLFASTGTEVWAGRQIFLLGHRDMERSFHPDGRSAYISGGWGHDGRWPLTIVSFLPEEATALWRGSRFGQRPPGYLAFKENKARELRGYLLKKCPELNGDLTIHDSATDLTLAHYSFGSGGGIYGWLHSAAAAPVLPLVRVKGLALAGQNIVLPGLLGVMVSAALAVGCLIGLDKVWEVLS